MRKKLVSTVFCLGFLAFNAPVAYTQGAPEVIVRPGDTIQWVALSGGNHRLNFGAAGTTPANQIGDILTFDPPLTNGESPELSGAPLAKATVKDAVGKTFVFTCGVHPAQMLSLTFEVAAAVPGQPARIHRISGETGNHWHLHVDTTQ